ncbi:MAG: D-alanyl-D-alanine carboxypeptidase [Lachnospiraceae bacterium]|nr:D-alanyl-D-alanine carboxypeptidase [Lachnospiraceae bacterium]
MENNIKNHTESQSRRENRADTYGSRYEDKNRRQSTGRYAGKSASAFSKKRGSSIRRQKRKRRKGRNAGRKAVLLCLAVFFILVIAVFAGMHFLGRSGQENVSGSQGILSFLSSSEITDTVPDVTVDLDSLYSPYAVLIDKNTGTVLGSKRSEEKIYPASMTKILSVWVAIENISDLDASVTMSADYYDALYAQNASQAGFEPGETTVILELLYGALLPSGAECCMQLAIEAAGSEEGLVELMNQKVEELGLTQSHFANCTGLHDDEQYTTVYEMALILQAALENETFRTVYTTHYHVISATDVHPDGFTVWSTFFKNVADEIVTGGEILGAKTGYTEEAGLCLATMAQVGEREYILVTAGWSSEDVGSYHILDAFAGYNLLGEALGLGEESTGVES